MVEMLSIVLSINVDWTENFKNIGSPLNQLSTNSIVEFFTNQLSIRTQVQFKGAGSDIIEIIAPDFRLERCQIRKEEAIDERVLFFTKKKMKIKKNKQDHPAPTRPRPNLLFLARPFEVDLPIGLGLTIIGVTIGMKICIFKYRHYIEQSCHFQLITNIFNALKNQPICHR